MSLTPPERETVITLNDQDEIAHVWTAQRKIITKLKRNPSAPPGRGEARRHRLG